MPQFCGLSEVEENGSPLFDKVTKNSRGQQRSRLLDERVDQNGEDAGSQPIDRGSAGTERGK